MPCCYVCFCIDINALALYSPQFILLSFHSLFSHLFRAAGRQWVVIVAIPSHRHQYFVDLNLNEDYVRNRSH